jgi:hypothetical protein
MKSKTKLKHVPSPGEGEGVRSRRERRVRFTGASNRSSLALYSESPANLIRPLRGHLLHNQEKGHRKQRPHLAEADIPQFIGIRLEIADSGR